MIPVRLRDRSSKAVAGAGNRLDESTIRTPVAERFRGLEM
jgi:hypothetical protein